MKSFKTLIIEDERLAREELKLLLKDYLEIEIIGEAKNGEEGLQKIKEYKPDLLFLDVSMPGMTGFEMLKHLEEIPRVIFITAYDEYALKAFEVNALDYILKPVDPDRLKEAIAKLSASEDDFVSNQAESLSRKNRQLTLNDRVFIKDGEKCWFIELSKVRMLESEGNYVKVYFDNFKPLILRSLNSFEDRLDPEYFFRANRKFIINLNWVSNIENWFNGGLQVELREGEKVEISRRQAIRFKELLSI
jgi:two-component system, LytTR family, response regulator